MLSLSKAMPLLWWHFGCKGSTKGVAPIHAPHIFDMAHDISLLIKLASSSVPDCIQDSVLPPFIHYAPINSSEWTASIYDESHLVWTHCGENATEV